MSTRERHGVKKRLYLSRPDPDIITTRTLVTRYIPESPPPADIITFPPPPLIIEAPPPPPPPTLPPLPEPEPEVIEVISVDVDEKKKKKKKKHHSKSRSRSRSHHRYDDHEHDIEESHDREVYIERDHFIPYPVPVEQKYDSYRYIDAPRRHHTPSRSPHRSPHRSPQRYIEDDRERQHIHIEDRRVRDYY